MCATANPESRILPKNGMLVGNRLYQHGIYLSVSVVYAAGRRPILGV